MLNVLETKEVARAVSVKVVEYPQVYLFPLIEKTFYLSLQGNSLFSVSVKALERRICSLKVHGRKLFQILLCLSCQYRGLLKKEILHSLAIKLFLFRVELFEGPSVQDNKQEITKVVSPVKMVEKKLPRISVTINYHFSV